MVHALRELLRVMKADGTLIDLRPVTAGWPIEVASRRETKPVGRVTDLPEAIADDAASNRAFSVAEGEGWLLRDTAHEFPFFYYWDSPNDMQTYIKEEWEDFARVEASVWAALRSAWAVADADARVRIKVKMLLTRWKALG